MIGKPLALAALLAGCSYHHPPFPAGMPDAAPDALAPSTGDASPGAVTIAVTVGGVPAAGVAVYFQNADSALVLAVSTDQRGTANAVLPAGGFVTAIEPPDGTGITRLATFADVAPSDALRLELAPAQPAASTTFSLTVPTMAGAAGYQIATSCGTAGLGATGTGTIALAGCGGSADIIVTAVDDGGAILGSISATSVTIDGQPRMLSGTYAALSPATFAYSDVPSTVTDVRTYQALATSRGRVFDASTDGAVAGGGVTNALAMPMAPGMFALTVSDGGPTASEHGEQEIYDWGAWTASYTLDVQAAMLPAFDSAPAYDPATHRVTWTERAAPTAPDVVRAQIEVDRDTIPQDTTWTWAIVAPRGSGPGVTYPQFPPGAFDYNPGAGDIVSVHDLTTLRVPGGYDAIRATAFANPVSYVAGPSGRIVSEQLYAPAL
jgi:hypothetical protein